MDRQVKKTLQWDLIRSVPLGFLESIGTTFGVLILVRFFQGDQVSKAWVVAAASIGLLLSLAVVQIVRRSGISTGKAMCGLHLCSAVGFLLISFVQDSVLLYVCGMLMGGVGLASSLPLMSQIYRVHYPNENRGSLFAYGGFVRKVFAIMAALLGGWLLERDIENFRILFRCFSAACVFMAFTVLQFSPVYLDKTKNTNLFSAFRHVRNDGEFRKLLTSWMVLGVGNLLCMSLFVEYISNRAYGYDLTEFSIGVVTTLIPEVVYLTVIMGWGKAFDRWNFYLLRAVLNVLFALGILVYFLGGGFVFLIVGIAIHGAAKAGGNVAWSLWTNKLAKPEHVAEYMSVHTFLTGCRGIASPFIALPLALVIPPQWIALLGALLIFIATVMIAPSIKFQLRRRASQVLDVDPRR